MERFEISITGWFAAAHQLRLYDDKLEPLHGHNWQVTATCVGPSLDRIGVLVDFTRLKPQLEAVLAGFHDRNLNELPDFASVNPSAENVACEIARRLIAHIPHGARLACVAVEEAPGCVARYFPDA